MACAVTRYCLLSVTIITLTFPTPPATLLSLGQPRPYLLVTSLRLGHIVACIRHMLPPPPGQAAHHASPIPRCP